MHSLFSIVNPNRIHLIIAGMLSGREKANFLDQTTVLCYLRNVMTRKKQQALTVGFIALGCAKNTVDSERMLAEIAQASLLIVAEPDNPADWQADVVVINTCGFIAPAVSESLDVIRHCTDCKVTGKVGAVIVTGCMAQRFGADLFDMVDGIDAVVGLGHRDEIAKIIQNVAASGRGGCYVDQPVASVGDDRVRLRINAQHWAYLRISEGCDHCCSFCTIPSIRGRFRSKSAETVLDEACELVESGVVELNLIGQDTTYYGRDRREPDALAALLGRLERIEGIQWIRLLYAYPTGISDRLIATMRDSDRIVHYLDMPLQHISDRLLKAMRRPDTKAEIAGLIERLRNAMPDIVLRTTLIVGFPGETQADFEELVEFVQWAQFDALGCFKYYPESGTKAAEMPNQIAESVKDERLDVLMRTQQEIAFARNAERLGRTLRCMVDWTDGEGTGVGRHYGQAPEVDSVCSIIHCLGSPGDVVEAKVVETEDYDLIVEQI